MKNEVLDRYTQSELHNLGDKTFLRILEDVKQAAIRAREQAVRVQVEIVKKVYDSKARRAAKGDVQRAMQNTSEVPAHFGYRNVFGCDAVKVML